MSDYDEYFDTLDEKALEELREFEAIRASASPSKPNATPVASTSNAVTSTSRVAATPSDDSDLFEFSLDNNELARIEEAAIQKQTILPAAFTTKFKAPVGTISSARQTNLNGGLVLEQSPPRKHQPHPTFGQKSNKTKVWDHTAFSKTGWKSTKPAKKGKIKGKARAKAKAEDSDAEENEEEYVDLEGLPTPFMPRMYLLFAYA